MRYLFLLAVVWFVGCNPMSGLVDGDDVDVIENHIIIGTWIDEIGDTLIFNIDSTLIKGNGKELDYSIDGMNNEILIVYLTNKTYYKEIEILDNNNITLINLNEYYVPIDIEKTYLKRLNGIH